VAVYAAKMEVERGVRKAKKRKSLLKNAKKYGKKGKFGRGTHLDEDIYQYFVHVLELVDTNKFETEEEKGS
jgi:nucleolar protein 9